MLAATNGKPAAEHQLFPVVCIGDGGRCQKPLSLRLCKTLLEPDQFSRLASSSAKAYIHKRPHEFKNCPSADCTQVYRVVKNGKTLRCPSCLISICQECHEEHQQGVDCRVSESENKRLYEQWKSEHDVKTCPKCDTDIEKIDGCNHIVCARCGSHLCWFCVKAFVDAYDVYEHMTRTHSIVPYAG